MLRELSCSVMVSGYPQTLYDALLGERRSVLLQAMSQAGAVMEKTRFVFDPDRMHQACFSVLSFSSCSLYRSSPVSAERPGNSSARILFGPTCIR
ncbi:MAG: hypothetical protein F4Z15_02885 [Gammaproteobacteria bacterium]|nr:hypothetical protein [Gammaproteobacteria bacterium]MYD76881.1 hypothetical protein [Gammaproteobacteria bacterium]